ncbi:hypothetical protein [Parasitella parasitica]|uniref:F-box domain-containing protein n=1 Tax=Parasitella parasitica TaxID=35722 RepID=A0A0B7NHP5_9FUNG|nr:hypothetical protein [Parasitella parasitica]
MSTFKLPPELLPTIFRFVDSTQQMAQCRLVSKSWNNFAEPAMFEKPFVIKTANAAWSLYQHLYHKPSNGKKIKCFAFFNSKNCDILTALQLELLQYVLNPNLEVVRLLFATDDNDLFFNKVRKIAQNPLYKFKKLKVFQSIQFYDPAYQSTLIDFKETIQQVRIKPSDNRFVNWLHRFKSLTVLEVDMSSSNVEQLNTALSECHSLQEIKVVRGMPTVSRTTRQLCSWAKRNVSTVKSVKKISFSGIYPSSEVIELLTIKYPQIEGAYVSLLYEVCDRQAYCEFIDRVINAFGRLAPTIYQLKSTAGLTSVLEQIRVCGQRHSNLTITESLLPDSPRLLLQIARVKAM